MTSTVERLTKDNWRIFSAEIAVILLLFVADVYGYVPFSKTPFLLLLGWVSLRVRGFRWHDVGFAVPSDWPRALGMGIAAGAGLSALELFVTQPALVAILRQPPDLSAFSTIVMQPVAFVVTLMLIWVVAAFGEELVYRGYLMTRFARLLDGTRAAWVASLIAVSILFGFSHVDLGLTGMIENVINGLLLGLLYLAAGRNLLVPITAHGVANSIDLTLIFLGKYPT